jgi:uncharacterized protein YndB with AHSA1/START domain
MTTIETTGITIERHFAAPPDKVWQLWTTKAGLEKWWGPIGFSSTVNHLDVRIGGDFEIAMQAIGAQQVAYLTTHGIPLESTARGTYTDVALLRRLAWRNLVDFVPGVDRYEVLATVDFAPAASGGTAMTFRCERMHDATWTRNAEMGWQQQIDRLVAELA